MPSTPTIPGRKLLVTVTTSAGDSRLSTGAFQIYDPGDPQPGWWAGVLSVDNVLFRLAQRWGGYGRVEFGSIRFSRLVFPEEKQVSIRIQTSDTGYQSGTGVITHFEGLAHRQTAGPDGITYALQNDELGADVQALDTVLSYSEESVAEPKAFGRVAFVKPLRLPDTDLGQPRYSLGGCSGLLARQVISFSPFGGATRVTTASAHGFSLSSYLYIEGDMQYEGRPSNIASTTRFDIPIPYTSGGVGHAYTADMIRVYDNGWPIPGNVTPDLSGNFFYLSAGPVGEVLLSGENPAIDTLPELFSWAAARIGCPEDTSGLTDTVIALWLAENSQINAFLSSVAEANSSLFYYKSGVLRAFGMSYSTQSMTVSRFFRPEQQTDETAAKAIITSEIRTWTQTGIATRIEAVAVESPYPYGDLIELLPCWRSDDISKSFYMLAALFHGNADSVSVTVPETEIGSDPVIGTWVTYEDRAESGPITFKLLAYQTDIMTQKISLSGQIVQGTPVVVAQPPIIYAVSGVPFSSELYASAVFQDPEGNPVRMFRNGVPGEVQASPQCADPLQMSGTVSSSVTITLFGTNGESFSSPVPYYIQVVTAIPVVDLVFLNDIAHYNPGLARFEDQSGNGNHAHIRDGATVWDASGYVLFNRAQWMEILHSPTLNMSATGFTAEWESENDLSFIKFLANFATASYGGGDYYDFSAGSVRVFNRYGGGGASSISIAPMAAGPHIWRMRWSGTTWDFSRDGVPLYTGTAPAIIDNTESLKFQHRPPDLPYNNPLRAQAVIRSFKLWPGLLT